MLQSSPDPSVPGVITANIRREVILVALHRLLGNGDLLSKLSENHNPSDAIVDTRNLLREAALSVGVHLPPPTSQRQGIKPDVFIKILGNCTLPTNDLKSLIEERLYSPPARTVRGGGCK
jgi:hypothetical protein